MSEELKNEPEEIINENKKSHEKGRKVITAIKKGVTAFVILGVIAGVVFLGTSYSKLKKVDTAIKIQGVSASDEALKLIAESLGTIDGKWVKYYYRVKPEYHNKVLTIGHDRIAGKNIDLNNNAKGRKIIVCLDDGYVEEIECDFEMPIYSDKDVDELVEIMIDEECDDKVLAFVPDQYSDSKSDVSTYSYQLVDKNKK